MDSANSKIFIIKEVKWTNDSMIRIKIDERDFSNEMILKQKLEKVSEDLSTGSFGAWVNILLFSHPAF